MGMFDVIHCQYPLPVEGANSLDFQTQDTPTQFLDLYEIRDDGSLWREAYDLEDHSDPTKEGISKLAGCMTKVNKRWVCEDNYTGEVRFYTHEPKLPDWLSDWLEFSAYFVKGKLLSISLVGKDV